MSTAPVIVIGMHRSGTSLVTRVLEQLGLFMGWRKENNDEAWFFHRLNIWLLAQAGGSWECPGAIRHVLDAPDVRATVRDYLGLMMRSPRAASYMGIGRYLRRRSITAMDGVWGWKDPRNTFTLPLWLDLFPEARVINVVRHGVDVAESLRKRHEWGYARLEARYRLLRPLMRLWMRQTPLVPSGRCKQLDGGFSLWEEYMDQARQHVTSLGVRALEIKYEDFLAAPEQPLRALCALCGLQPDEARLAAALRGIKPERAFAYRQHPALVSYAAGMKDRLAAFGYQAV